MTSSAADAKLTANSPSAYTDLSGLSALKRDAKVQQNPETVRKVAQQFESIFAKMVLSSMRQASFGDSLFGSDQQQFYQGMFDDQLAVDLTKGKGLGLADMLVQQLTRSGLVKGADAGGASQDGTNSAADVAGKKGALSLGAATGAGMMRDSLFNTARGDQRAFSAAPSAPGSASGTASGSGIATRTGSGRGTASDTAVGSASALRGPRGNTAGWPFSASASETQNSVSSTLLGTTDDSALDATTKFIDKMLAGNAAANASADATAQKQWQSGSPEQFVQQLWPCAEEAGKALGIDPKHLLAQAALETGWGKSLPCDVDGTPSFNFFGIKAGSSWQGDSVSARTLEFEGGVPIPQKAKFRAYDSPAESFRDYVEVLRNNPRYADALNTGSNAKAFASALQKGGYATDPRYAMKIETIAQNLPFNETALKSSPDAPMTSPTDVF